MFQNEAARDPTPEYLSSPNTIPGVRVRVLVHAADPAVGEAAAAASGDVPVVVGAVTAVVAAGDDVAAVIVGDDVGDAAVDHLVKRLPESERHKVLVLRHTQDVITDVPWTVVRKSELKMVVPLLIEQAEAEPVELLASVRPAAAPSAPGKHACVASVSSTFIVVAMDDPPPDPSVSFVLPGAGRIVVTGHVMPVYGRPGLWRISPDSEEVRSRLVRFTLKRAEGHEGTP